MSTVIKIMIYKNNDDLAIDLLKGTGLVRVGFSLRQFLDEQKLRTIHWINYYPVWEVLLKVNS